MKKTLIAMAAVAVAGVASAAPTISGIVDLGYTAARVTADGETLGKSNGVSDGVQNGGRLIIKDTEDLGAGLSVGLNLEYAISPSDKAQTLDSRQSHLTLSGGFGSLAVGRVYSLHHSNQGAGDLVGNVSVLGYLGGLDSLVRASDTVIYTMPSFGAVSVAAEFMTDPSLQSGASKKSTGHGVRVSYAADALYVGYAQETSKNTAVDLSKLAGVEVESGLAFPVEKRTAKNISATYDMGIAKVGLVSNSTKYDQVSWKANTASVSIPMNALTLLASIGSGKIKDETADLTVKGHQIGVKYDMSKRTNLYLYSGTTKFKQLNVKGNQTSIGLKHSF